MSVLWLVVAVLGVWRITHLAVAKDGPGRAIARLRAIARRRGLEDLLECFYCASLWVAIPFALALGSTLAEQLMLWPALSGAAIVVDRLVGHAEATTPALYTEHAPTQAEDDDLLSR